MKTALHIVVSLAASAFLRAQEPSKEIVGLESAAREYVIAYNEKDADALSKLFTENGEITNLDGDQLTSGRAAIKARYENHFSEAEISDVSIEVDSVRLVAPGLAIEDGTAHFTPAGDPNAPSRSVSYTAVLHQDKGGDWLIASSRSLHDVSGAEAQLADLAKAINGDWTCRTAQGVRLDLAFGWHESGKFLSGDLLVSASDVEAQKGRIRIGWNAARKAIVSWMFDAEGGVTQGIWTRVDDGWVVRSTGTTSDGENITAIQKFSAQEDNSVIWSITNRLVDDQELPSTSLRLVRPAPSPSTK